MNQHEENLTTEYLYNEPVSEPVPVVVVEQKVKEEGKGVYTFFSVFFFILALAGLFIGLITAVWPAFQQATGLITYGEDNPSTFSYSMLGQMCNIFGDLFGANNIKIFYESFASSISLQIWLTFNLFLVFAIVLAAVLALVLMIIAIVTKRKKMARMCALTSGMVLLLVYVGYFLLAYAVGGAFGTALIDAPTALIGALLLVTLIAIAIYERKIFGFLASLLLVLTIVAIMMLNYYTAALTLASSFLAFDFYSSDMFLGIALTLLVVVLGFNFVASVIRIAPKKSYVFDAVRYGVQLFAVILAIIAFMVSKHPDVSKYGTWGIFTAQGQTLATVLLLLCTIAAFVVALLATLLPKKEVIHEVQEVIQEVEDPTPQPVYEPAYIGYAPVIQPIVVTQPPVYQQPVYQQPPQPAPQPAETHVYVQQPERPEVPVTEFERKMQSIARGNSSVYDPSPVPVNSERMNAETPNTYSRARADRNQTPQSSYIYEGSQYSYDPFIRTLTVPERNEFGDLFIANIYGMHSYLPTYVIGGDNKIFFDRVFIYLGCYRNYISQQLLEKIYLYVSKR